MLRVPKEKWLIILLSILVFAKYFGSSGLPEQSDRFKLLSVPSQKVSFGDIRNLQAAAICANRGEIIYGNSICVHEWAPWRKTDPDFVTPKLNYPPVWVRIFSLGDPESEKYITLMGWLNAALIIATLAIVCYRWSPLLFPLFLFSPPVLLCIERGNNDGTTFAALFLGIIISRGIFLKAFSMGIASGLKVFPAFATAACFIHQTRKEKVLFAIGAMCGLLLLYETWLTLPQYLHAATTGFNVAYGISSWRHSKFFSNNPPFVFYFSIFTFLAVAALYCWRFKFKNAKNYHQIEVALEGFSNIEKLVIWSSITIFLATFLLSASWAYRIIFLIPGLALFSSSNNAYLKQIAFWGMILLWVPILGGEGWRCFNFLTSLLFVLLSPLILIDISKKLIKNHTQTNFDAEPSRHHS